LWKLRPSSPGKCGATRPGRRGFFIAGLQGNNFPSFILGSRPTDVTTTAGARAGRCDCRTLVQWLLLLLLPRAFGCATSGPTTGTNGRGCCCCCSSRCWIGSGGTSCHTLTDGSYRAAGPFVGAQFSIGTGGWGRGGINIVVTTSRWTLLSLLRLLLLLLLFSTKHGCQSGDSSGRAWRRRRRRFFFHSFVGIITGPGSCIGRRMLPNSGRRLSGQR